MIMNMKTIKRTDALPDNKRAETKTQKNKTILNKNETKRNIMLEHKTTLTECDTKQVVHRFKSICYIDKLHTE